MPSVESEVLAANDAFYAAFAERDATAMERLWAEDVPLVCIHPGWDVLVGREESMESWRAILGGRGAPPIRHSRAEAYVHGDTAFVVCVEDVGDSELIATNSFIRQQGAWKLVHHQAGPLARR